MRTRNPFQTAERIGRVAASVIGTAFCVAVFAIIGAVIWSYYGWGWWTLLLIPGIVVAWALVVAIGGLMHLAADLIHDAWLMAKWRWDDRHPDYSNVRPIVEPASPDD